MPALPAASLRILLRTVWRDRAFAACGFVDVVRAVDSSSTLRMAAFRIFPYGQYGFGVLSVADRRTVHWALLLAGLRRYACGQRRVRKRAGDAVHTGRG